MQIIWIEKFHKCELGNSDYCMSIVKNNKAVTAYFGVTVLVYAYIPGVIINSPFFHS